MVPLDTLLVRLESFTKNAAEETKKIMVEETPVGPTGRLRRSIRIIEEDERHAIIGTDVEYAQAVEEGRKGFSAKTEPSRRHPESNRRHSLHYWGYKPGPKSIHLNHNYTDDSNVEYFRSSVGPADPNPFAKRTAEEFVKRDWGKLLEIGRF